MSNTETRKVTMRSVTLLANGDTANLEAVDYVPLDILDVYVADAQTRWQYVGVGDENDSGPNTDEEPVVPEHLVGKSVEDFAVYGDSSTPHNALDESLGS